MNPQDLDTTVQTGSAQGAATQMKICPKCGMERLPTTKVCPADGTVLPDAPAPSDNPLSTLSDKYEFLGETGRGGMAIIYRAKNRETGRFVAIKKMIAATLTETAFMRFEQEAAAITSLRHPNIIMVHEFGVAADGEPYMVMDFIEGSNLGQLIKEKGNLTVEESMHRFIQLCDALQHAHNAGVLHRDLKPGNVMLSSTDGSFADARLVDFGIAKLMAKEGEDAEKLTMTGQLFGSPPYMSPEQCRGFNLDARTDVYSMGCVMFETLTGRVPIRGESILETIMMQVSEPAPLMKDVRPDLEFPPIIENIIAKALAKEPDDRYQSMRELMVALMEAGVEMRSPGTVRVIQAPAPKPLIPPSVYMGMLCFVLFISAIFAVLKEQTLANQKKALKASEDHRMELLQSLPPKDLSDDLLKDLIKSPIITEEFNLQDAERITDKGLKHLTILPRLKKVVLANTHITDEGLKELVKLPHLYNLDLRNTNVTNEGMKTLLQAKQLNTLSVSQTQVDNNGMDTIAQMKNLSNLSIAYLSYVNGSGIAKLKDLNLRWLFLSGLGLDDGLLSIRNMQSLRLLDLENCRKAKKCLSQIRGMLQLRSLNIEGTSVTTEDMQNLATLTNLVVLHAGRLDITDGAIDPLLNLPRLYELSLDSTRITDKGAAKLAGIKSLARLNLAATRIGDEAVAAIATLPHLEKLDLEGTNVSDIGLEKLLACKTLNELRLSRCPNLTSSNVAAFDRKFNDIDKQEKDLEAVYSQEGAKRKLAIEFNTNSRRW